MKIYDPKLKTVTMQSLDMDEKCNKSDAWCYLNNCDHDVFYWGKSSFIYKSQTNEIEKRNNMLLQRGYHWIVEFLNRIWAFSGENTTAWELHDLS